MHSTDTHSYTETIFGISHLLDIVFAPRIQNIKKQVLSSFDSIRKSLEAKGYSIVPRHKINTQLIIDHWDLILRLRLIKLFKGFLFDSPNTLVINHAL